MEFSVDHALPVPLGVQLRGLIEYGIACGELMPGDRLPSVRDMATQLGIAPMTVSRSMRSLQEAGLIEAHPGQGTFVSRAAAGFARPQLAALQRRVDDLIDAAAAEGIGAAELARLFNAPPASRPIGGPRAADRLRRRVRRGDARLCRGDPAPPARGDTITGITLDEFTRSDVARQRALSADLIADLRQPQGARWSTSWPGTPGRDDPLHSRRPDAHGAGDHRSAARVGVISTFPEFLPIMKAGVQRFAPHVRRLEATVLESPDLKERAAPRRRRGLCQRLRADPSA